MSLNIKNPEVDRLARELSERTGESITAVVLKALRERLLREDGRNLVQPLKDEILLIGRRCAALPDLDRRSPDDILGHNASGVPE